MEHTVAVVGPKGIEDFERAGILLAGGVYALFYRREVVYVGKAKMFLYRLYQHRNNYLRNRRGHTVVGSGKAIPFDDVRLYPCEPALHDIVERAMIARYKPTYNTQLVPKIRTPIPLVINGVAITLNAGIVAPKPKPAFERRV